MSTPEQASDTASPRDAEAVRERVRSDYGDVARAAEQGVACGETAGCCGVDADPKLVSLASIRLGYSEGDLDAVPQGADLGLGCGNPRAIASLRRGEVVIDLGSGGGLDCFLAAREVGEKGRVIGVDMTPDMLAKARRNAHTGGYPNVEFRLGEIEHLPIEDGVGDVIISNCVINLSPDKPQVFREAFRVLRPGGRLAISDVVATAELPREMKQDPKLHSGCMAGALLIGELEAIIGDAGFEAISIGPKDESRAFIREWAPGRGVEDYLVSASIEAVKP